MKLGKRKTSAKPNTKERAGIDIPFLLLVLCLLGFGLVMVSSASYVSAYYKYSDSFYFIKRQAIFALLGIGAMFFFAFFNYKWFKKKVWLILLVALIMVVLVLIPGIGIKVNGARRWLGIGGFRIQPSELAKFAVIVFLSSYISINHERMKRFDGLLPAVAVLGIFTFLVAIETHFSGAILIFCVGAVMLFIGGMSIRTLLSFGALGGGGLLCFILFTDYAKVRLETWFNPFANPTDEGFQIVQSLYAIGSGGVFGLGLGQSRQKHLYIPEPQNDYIFSIVCEELGFVGALVVLLLFILLIWRGYNIAFHMKDKFSMMLVAGIITRVAIQVIFNIAVVTNAFPSTGISLPFFSYGGTALLVLMAEMGIVLSVSRFSTLDKEKV